MQFNKPEVEFIPVEMNISILTTSGTQGGERCTGTEQDCEDVANLPITCVEEGAKNA